MFVVYVGVNLQTDLTVVRSISGTDNLKVAVVVSIILCKRFCMAGIFRYNSM